MVYNTIPDITQQHDHSFSVLQHIKSNHHALRSIGVEIIIKSFCPMPFSTNAKTHGA